MITRCIRFSVGCHSTARGPDYYRLSSEFVGHACRRLVAHPQARDRDITIIFEVHTKPHRRSFTMG